MPLCCSCGCLNAFVLSHRAGQRAMESDLHFRLGSSGACCRVTSDNPECRKACKHRALEQRKPRMQPKSTASQQRTSPLFHLLALFFHGLYTVSPLFTGWMGLSGSVMYISIACFTLATGLALMLEWSSSLTCQHSNRIST